MGGVQTAKIAGGIVACAQTRERGPPSAPAEMYFVVTGFRGVLLHA